MTTSRKADHKAMAKKQVTHAHKTPDSQHVTATSMKTHKTPTKAAKAAKKPKPVVLTTDQKLTALILFLKNHGIHFEGAGELEGVTTEE